MLARSIAHNNFCKPFTREREYNLKLTKIIIFTVNNDLKLVIHIFVSQHNF